MKARIGLLFLSHPLTFTSYALKEAAVLRDKVTSKLAALKMDFVVVSDLICDINRAASAIDEIAQNRVDAVVLFFCSWTSEEIPLRIGQEIRCPLILWCPSKPLGDLPLPSPLTGLVSAASNFHRLGIPFRYFVGSVDEDDSFRRIQALSHAAAAASRLKKARIGYVGGNNPGMIDVAFDQMAFRKLGIELLSMDLSTVLRRCETVSEPKVSEALDSLRRSVGNVVEPSEKQLRAAVRFYLALKELVVENKLDAVAVRCWPELRDIGVSPCYAISRISDEGIVGICENDLVGGLTQLVLQWLGGSATYTGDFTSVVPDSNVIELSHCGAAPLSLAERPSAVQVRSHMRTGMGTQMEFPLKHGRVTLAKLRRPDPQTLKMLITDGEVVETPQPRGNTADIRLAYPVGNLIDVVVSEGFEHHMILTYGNVKQELIDFCDFAGIARIVL